MQISTNFHVRNYIVVYANRQTRPSRTLKTFRERFLVVTAGNHYIDNRLKSVAPVKCIRLPRTRGGTLRALFAVRPGQTLLTAHNNPKRVPLRSDRTKLSSSVIGKSTETRILYFRDNCGETTTRPVYSADIVVDVRFSSIIPSAPP